MIEEKPADYEELVESKLLIEYFAGYEEMCRKRFDELNRSAWSIIFVRRSEKF